MRSASGMRGEDFALSLLERLDETTERLEHSLMGNGGPGVLTRLEVAERLAEERRVAQFEIDRRQDERLRALEKKHASAVTMVQDAIQQMPTEAAVLSVWKVRWEVVNSAIAVLTALLVFAMQVWGA